MRNLKSWTTTVWCFSAYFSIIHLCTFWKKMQLRIINYINETLSLAEVGWGQHARVSHKAISAEWLVFPIGGDNLL